MLLTDKNSKSLSIDQYILDLVKSSDLETVEQLITRVQLKYSTSKQEAMKHIINLQNQGKIILKNPSTPISSTLANYLLTNQAYWYWTTIALAIIATTLVFTVPEEAYPLAYARHILGLIFILWLPGYTFIKVLFPTKIPIQTSSTELDSIERIALSIGMSLVLVPIIGLLLNYTPFGIQLAPITLSLLALTLTSATAAITREYKANLKENVLHKKDN